VASEPFDNPYSDDFRVKVFKNILDGSENIVIQKGVINRERPTFRARPSGKHLGDVFRGGN
jgi:hypothetical protein